MGESGTRRSTLVSRLPIFRRSVRKRQDSLPSSPSSGGVGNGVHTSSPSSTNSSSSSTSKRRSLFRTPSLSFHSKRNSDPTQLSLDNRSQGSEDTFRDGSISKTRHSFGFGGHKKKNTRSQTENLEKTSTNRSVFINCISSRTNEGDDSGFLDDVSSKRSSKHKKQLLPKSLSAHQRFSKNLSNVPDQGKCQDAAEDPPKTGTPGSWPGELAESSLQSPMISEDRTTAITPSDFVHVTEDSVSEVDALPAPSPAAPPEKFSQAVSTSQVSFTPAQASTEKHLLPDTSHTANTQCESTTAHTEPVTLQTVKELDLNTDPNANPDQSEASENEQAPELSENSSSNPDTRGRRSRNTVLIQQAGRSSCLSKLETRPSHLRKPHTVSMCSSVSPYHEVMRMERRLRSASEGAGGPRLHLNLRDPHCMEGNTLSKQRTSSSSSKLGSLDVLNNLGSSELDEDDLMLDLDLSDDQRPRHGMFLPDSSCSLLFTFSFDPSREQRPMSLCLSRDDESLPGLEALPFRLMQQDCTAVKTLLLRLRRTLQESTEISPACSLHSLPISPCSEKSLPFKDPGREENQFLQQQLKEKDELIVRLQAELESTALKSLCQKADKSTQTDFLLSEAIHQSRPTGQNSNIPSSSLTRERRPARTSAADQHSRPCEERACSNGGVGLREPLRRAEVGQSMSEVSGPRKTEHPGPSQIPRAVAGSSVSLPSKRGPIPRLQSSFTSRLGQPPRGPLSLHMYSRKNVFLQHSLHTAELQALAQQDG
uniref:Coiled-coil serine rich protein 1 n=1 Tax=Sinocyclocheilus grahami TaxID=75366 RepID=A0A672S402_SINGR